MRQRKMFLKVWFAIGFFIYAILRVHGTEAAEAPSMQGLFQAESSKIQFILQGGQSQISVGSKKFSEYGLKTMMSFFPFRRLAFYGSYFAVIKPDGSSNLNGLGFGGKFYINGAGSSVTLKSFNTTLMASPEFAYYAGMEFMSRDLRSNSVNLNFTGFSYSLGVDWHFHYKWFGNLEGQYSNLKNALGSSTAQNLKIMAVSIGLGIMI
ncbi:MAG: hypothetical protein HYV97_15505 [Bdellovibrio sp.]|nr:hypothetical protein [Bdellovibrio sp.]